MTVNLAYITDIASEFASADSARVDRLAVLASSRTPDTVWIDPVQRELGIAYLVCHMLKVDALRGNGPVTSESIGDLSRSYGTSVTADDLNSTGYGREYLALRKGQPRGPCVV